MKGHRGRTHQSGGCPQQRSAEPLECGGETNIVRALQERLRCVGGLMGEGIPLECGGETNIVRGIPYLCVRGARSAYKTSNAASLPSI